MTDAIVLQRSKARPSKRPAHCHNLLAAPLVNTAPMIGASKLKKISMHPDAVRARDRRTNGEKLRLRWVPGRWVRDDAVTGFVAELEVARPEYRDGRRSEKEYAELAADDMRRLFEERYGRPRKPPRK